MSNKNTLPLVVTAIICLCLVLLSLSLFNNLKKSEVDFNEKKAILVKENLDLKDRAESLQETLNQKTEIVTVLEKDKKRLEEQATTLKDDNDRIRRAYREQLDKFRKKKVALKKRISSLSKGSIAQRIKEALLKESNVSIKSILADALNKIELIKAGKTVNLEPIVVTKKDEATGKEVPASQDGQGVILSLDKKNNLIVINLGRKDNVKEGDSCKILKDGQEIASAEILSVRYRIAAALINEIQYKNTVRDIKEGFKVSIVQK